jgi:hypothetical protein
MGAGRGKDAPNGAAAAFKNNEILSPSDEQIDAARGREISAKAVTGTLVLLLKWLKLSRMFTTDPRPCGLLSYRLLMTGVQTC